MRTTEAFPCGCAVLWADDGSWSKGATCEYHDPTKQCGCGTWLPMRSPNSPTVRRCQTCWEEARRQARSNAEAHAPIPAQVSSA